MPAKEPNGWNQWAKFVLNELERLDKNVTELDTKLDKIILDLATFKTEQKLKAGFIGFLTGLVPAILSVLLVYLKVNGGG